MRKSKILFVTSEIYPFVVSGRGSEFSSAFPTYLASKGHEVRVMMPKYSIINERKHIIRDIIRLSEIEVPSSSGKQIVSVKSGFLPESKTQVYFGDYPKYFKRSGLFYDPKTKKHYEDNPERFIFFSRLIISTLRLLGWQPNLIHCCDWQLGALPAMINLERQKDSFFGKTGVLYSVFNLSDPGMFSKAKVEGSLVADEKKKLESGMGEHRRKFSFLKAGIDESDAVTLPDYYPYLRKAFKLDKDVQEILDGKKSVQKISYYGDSNLWNPASHNSLHKPYTLDKLDKRQKNKEEFLKATSLDAEKFVLGVLVEDDTQTGELVSVLKLAKKESIQLVVYSQKNFKAVPKIKNAIESLRSKMHLIIEPAEQQKNKFLAATDIVYVPGTSDYSEVQYLNALNYGALPLIEAKCHVAGYLDPIKENSKKGTAFTFKDSSELSKQIGYAKSLFENKEAWHHHVKKAMKVNLSWEKSLNQFLKLYEKTLNKL